MLWPSNSMCKMEKYCVPLLIDSERLKIYAFASVSTSFNATYFVTISLKILFSISLHIFSCCI